jgi:acetyl-CoA carboxylase biotin carboxyl carrier protein
VELSDLKDILRMLEEQDITEFELEQDGVKLRVCRQSGGPLVPAGPPAVVLAPSVPSAAPPAANGPPGAGGASEAAPAPVVQTREGLSPSRVEEGTLVKSPIVGTFYRAPDPNSPPFVSVGDRVNVGQVLCIVEAMKLMNEIEAEVAGEVLKVHPENGQPVQYGDALFTIRPS